MTKQVSKLRWMVGSGLLAGSLIFGITGVAISAVEGNLPPAPINALYLEECGACHLHTRPVFYLIQAGRNDGRAGGSLR